MALVCGVVSLPSPSSTWLSSLNRHLNQEHSRQKAIFEDPRKWTPNNCHLYKNFLLWRREVPVATHYRVKLTGGQKGDMFLGLRVIVG